MRNHIYGSNGVLEVHAATNSNGEMLGSPQQFDDGVKPPPGMNFYLSSRVQFWWLLEWDTGSRVLQPWKIPGDLQQVNDKFCRFQRFVPGSREKLNAQPHAISDFMVTQVLWSTEPSVPGGQLPLAIWVEKAATNTGRSSNFVLIHCSLVPKSVLDSVTKPRATAHTRRHWHAWR